MLKPLIKLLRPHQYMKNGFVLLGVIFSQQWHQAMLVSAGLVFAAFCAISSSIYILNDLFDQEADRNHPVKRRRPIASGEVPPDRAKVLLVIMLTAALLLAAKISFWALGFVAGYFVLNIAYSWRLNSVVILDVFIIAGGFLLRILAGTIGLGIPPSHWLLLCGLMLTLFLGFAKRSAELRLLPPGNNGNCQKALDDYSPVMLEQFLSVTGACTVISYGLYTVSPETINLHQTGALIYTLPFVVYGIFRYLYLLHRHGIGGDTSRDLLGDFHMLATVAAWLLTTLVILS